MSRATVKPFNKKLKAIFTSYMFSGPSVQKASPTPACPAWGEGVEMIVAPVVSASRERLRKSPLRGETRRRSALSVASTSQPLLPDDAALLVRQFCDCLRDRINDFICFRGIDFV